MVLSRRELLQRSAATGAAFAVVGSLGELYSPSLAWATPAGGFGPLVADPAGMLDLPAGFSYSIVARSQAWNSWTAPTSTTPGGVHPEDYNKPVAPGPTGATPYTDSLARYGALYYRGNNSDGTGSFAGPNGGTILVQNSELNGATTTAGGVPQSGVPTYDPGHRGGTSTMVIDSNGVLTTLVASIAGTYGNCAGGTTPWGTWLTCEETESYNASSSLAHGYVFEVAPQDALLPAGTPVANLTTKPIPYTAMGRFAHEAVAVDPLTKNAYLTEDAGASVLATSSTGYSNNGLFYKFVPTNTSGGYGSYAAGGTLYAMKAGTLINLAQAKSANVGQSYSVTWVPVPNANPTAPTLTLAKVAGFNSTQVRNQFTAEQVTQAKKLEGVWFGNGKVYINCSYAKSVADTNGGGSAHEGQVWIYDPAAETITLAWHNNPGGIFDGPDNIVVSPYGGAFLCEDGDGDNYIVGLDGANQGFAFAKNRIWAPGEYAEFTGACFSPDGKFLFVNTQVPGITYAITGPWNPAPDPVVPEVPKAIMMPLAAAALLGGAALIMRRRADAFEQSVAAD